MNDIRILDLNIEEILNSWEIYHGIREIIANAIDEQMLTDTEDIQVFQDRDEYWHIRDYGRGIRYEHFTQKENEEKLKNFNLIGKFGIGLKDALATFDRNGIYVLLKSKFGDVTTGKFKKHDFDDIKTLHAVISPPSESNLIGTDVLLKGIKKESIEKAKALFLRFSDEKLVESTNHGEVYENTKDKASIYINGVKVAEEENFLFSYNIIALTKQIRNALNRERTNVGRNAYRDKVMKILLSCKGENIAKLLIQDVQKIEQGTHHDELSWIDVQKHAVKILSSKKDSIFVTSFQIQNSFNKIDDAKSRGLNVVTIPESLRNKIHGLKDISGNTIRDIDQFIKEDYESFKFKFIDPSNLNISEKKIFDLTNNIFDLFGGKPRNVKDIKISETMRKDPSTYTEVDGLWESSTSRIIIKRSTLRKLEEYSGVLIHETTHCLSNFNDLSRGFELELTRLIGILASKCLKLEFEKKNL